MTVLPISFELIPNLQSLITNSQLQPLILPGAFPSIKNNISRNRYQQWRANDSLRL